MSTFGTEEGALRCGMLDTACAPVLRWLRLLLAASTLLHFGVLTAQTGAANPEQTLHDALANRQLYLRGLSDDPEVHVHWQGSTLTPDAPPSVRALSAFTLQKVKLKSQSVTLEGVRDLVVRTDTGYALAGLPRETQVVVDFSGADLAGGGVAGVLPQLPALLFFHDRDEALAAIPEGYRRFIPGRLNGALEPVFRETCDCAAEGTPACQGKLPSEGFVPAKPRTSTHALLPRGMKEGLVRVAFTIETTGHVTDLWLVISGGAMLDQKVLVALRSDEYFPATCHGAPHATLVRKETKLVRQ